MKSGLERILGYGWNVYITEILSRGRSTIQGYHCQRMMNKEQALSAYVYSVLSYLTLKMESVLQKWLSLGFIWVFCSHNTLWLTKYLPYKHKYATNSTAMNLSCNVHHLTVCAFSIYGWIYLTAHYALCCVFKEECIKVKI